MNGKWSGNSFLLGSSSLPNQCCSLSCFFFPPYLPRIQWMVRWCVVVDCWRYCRTFTVLATSFQIFNYFSFFHSGSNDKNFLNSCHFQRASCRPEINEMTRQLLQHYITSLSDSQKPKASRIGTWREHLRKLSFQICAVYTLMFANFFRLFRSTMFQLILNIRIHACTFFCSSLFGKRKLLDDQKIVVYITSKLS